MKTIQLLLSTLLLSGIYFSAFAQANTKENVTISGYIKDAASNETLIGATVYEVEGNQGTTTNAYGFYSLTLPKGIYTVNFSYVGFQTQAKEIELKDNVQLDIELSEGTALDEVVVTAEKSGPTRHEENRMSVNKISMSKVKALPVLLGERDVLKIIQLLPGVQSGTEGSSGLYVRGGGADQNLILLDGVPIYNANHLFGFLSTFNGDAIKSAEIIKGGFPARYGGRLSSIIDIRMKEGNMREFHGNASVGVISGKLNLEGPIIKDKTSFSISGRRTWFDAFSTPIQRMRIRQGKQDGFGNYYFYDFNAKINHKFSDKNRLYLSAYMGDDKLNLDINTEYEAEEGVEGNESLKNDIDWGNRIFAARWNLQWSPKLFSNTTLTYSQYNYKLGAKFVENTLETDPNRRLEYEFGSRSAIKDYGAKIDFSYLPNPNHYIRFGGNFVKHQFTPTVIFEKANFEGVIFDLKAGEEKLDANEFAAYVEDDIRLGRRFKVNLGVHFSGFQVRKTNYTALQPRIATSYLINDKMSIKASYSQMTQFIHLLTSPGLGLPTDLWVPSTDRIKPENSTQYAIGFTRTLPLGLELNIEGFYKTMENLLEYKAGVNVFGSSSGWEDKIEIGNGESYGMEILLEKKVGKTTGWLGYTLSWSNRTFENINDGESFPYRYDRRHDVSLALTHKFSDRMDVGLVWIYGTGNAYTLATQRYLEIPSSGNSSFYPQAIDHISKRNNQRMAAYHRMDISMNLHKNTKIGKRTWSLGFYNTYNRRNPFAVFLNENFDGRATLTQVSLLPILPFVSYNLAF